MSKRLSVIIPTYNRRERLAMVLEGLDRQSTNADDFEVVIVDDGSTDGTSDWLATQRKRYAVHTLMQPNGGPARARNAGVAAAGGELVLFIDDDVVPTPDLIAEHLRSHAVETGLVVMGPLASLPHYRQPWIDWEQRKIEAQYEAMARGDWPPSFRQFWTGNASLERAEIVASGGFNTTYLRAEDIELGWRLHERGLKFRFNPAARGMHHAERSLESWKNAHRSYGRLEVSILSRAGEEDLIFLLAKNWARLHPLVRWIVLRTRDNPHRSAQVVRGLERLINAEMRIRQPIGASQACSMVANVMYWSASFEELGPERSARVRKWGTELIDESERRVLGKIERWLRVGQP